MQGAPSGGIPSSLSAVARAEERLTLANAFGGDSSGGDGSGSAHNVPGCGGHGRLAAPHSGACCHRLDVSQICLPVRF